MKKLTAIFCMAAVSVMLLGPVYSADENKAASAMQRSRPGNIAFISGSISKIDTAVPGSVKLEVINEVDGKSHIVEIGTNTNILKAVDIEDLKAGDKARVVARKADDKEIALSVVTGKLKEIMTPRPRARTVPAPIKK
ncbi:MAG: hypothetical protein WC419_05330 [Candidatus Omnitrophota bacterium]